MEYRTSMVERAGGFLLAAIFIAAGWLVARAWRLSYLRAATLVLVAALLLMGLASAIVWVIRGRSVGPTLVDLGRPPTWLLWAFVAVGQALIFGSMALEDYQREGDRLDLFVDMGLMILSVAILWHSLVKIRVTAAGILSAVLFVEWSRIVACRWEKKAENGPQLLLDVRPAFRLLGRDRLRTVAVSVPAEKTAAMAEVLRWNLLRGAIPEGSLEGAGRTDQL